MIELFEKAGIMIYPLIFASIIALTFIIERAIALRKRKILIPEILAVVDHFSGINDMELAGNVCNKHDGPLPNIVKMGLKNSDLPKEGVKEILEDEGRQQIRKLKRGLGVLETIAAIAPLLGLLGTVLGMVKVFSVIQDQGIGQTAALSGGISEALLTTVIGLFIGIPVLIAYNYFNSKAQNLILDIEKYTNTLIYKIHKMNHKDGGKTHAISAGK
jgi:biopolymer transport protein ExbB